MTFEETLDNSIEVNDNNLAETPATTYNGDPFTLDEEGRYVGHDGFVCPKNFSEFYDRFPKFIHYWLRKPGRASNFSHYGIDIEDMESELMLYLMAFPEESVFIKRGIADRIEAFDPEQVYGASEKRFFHYISRCLCNRMVDDIRRLSRNLVSYHSDIHLIADVDVQAALTSVHDSWQNAIEATDISDRVHSDMNFERFIQFMARNSPDLLPMFNLLMTTDTLSDAHMLSGVSLQMFNRARRRIRELHVSFTQGTAIPKQRKVYSLRGKKVSAPVLAPAYS